MAPTAQSIWSLALNALREMLKPEIFNMWFAPLQPSSLHEGVLRLSARDDFSAAWLRDNYSDLLRAVLLRVSNEAIQPLFESDLPSTLDPLDSLPGAPSDALPANAAPSDLPSADPAAQSRSNSHPHPKHKAHPGAASQNPNSPAPGFSLQNTLPHTPGPAPRPGDNLFNPNNTFDTFVVGNNNALAHGAAIAVAQSPGKTYNPLFLMGGVGLGKTHLLHAIGHHVLHHRRNARVAYLSCEKFTNEFIDALQNNVLPKFRKRYRLVDVLLIDDVQFLGGKERIQEEFFHTFNALHENGKQIVLTCDRPANEIQGLEQRLISRFEWGLTADLQAPDVETRLAILRKKEKLLRVELPDNVRNFLAERIRTNIRRLEGAYVRVASFATLTGKPITLEAVESMLREILQEEGRQIVSIDLIQKRVAEHYDIRLADMTSKRRPENIAFPRQVAMYLARQLTDSSLSAIGDAFGGRDHGTVLHACRAVKDRMETDPNARQTIQYIEKQLTR